MTEKNRARTWLVVLALAAWATTFRSGFLLDDHKLIPQNLSIQRWSWEDVIHDFNSNVFNDVHEDPYYRPLVTLFDRLDFSLWGLHAGGYHFTNWLFHIGACLLLYEWLLLLGFSGRVSFLASALLCVEPMAADLFLLITARGEQMAMFFSLAALIVLLVEGSVAWIWSLPLYALAIFSKESSIILPVLAALMLWYARRPARCFARLLPLVLLSIPYLLLRHRVVGDIVNAAPDLILRFFAEAFPRTLLDYCVRAFFPFELHFPRHMPPLSPLWPAYALMFVIGAGVFLKRGPRWALFSAGWIIINLLPKIPSMVTMSFALDHWFYASLPGVTLVLAMLLDQGLRSSGWKRRIYEGGIVGLLLAWIGICNWNTRIRASDESALRHALKYEDLQSLRFKLGALLWQKGNDAEALPLLETAYAREPEICAYGNALALVYWDLGDHTKAFDLLNRIARDHPEDEPTRQNLLEMRRRLM